MSNMFKEVTKTWNPYQGCKHFCDYCWARKLAEGKLKQTTKKYEKGFEPRFFPEWLNRVPSKGTIFVSSMGDLFGIWNSSEMIKSIINATKKSKATFLFLTKNPKRYHEFVDLFDKEKHYLGTTLESDNEVGVSASCPSRMERFKEFTSLNYPNKFVSIEPIMDFNLDRFLTMIMSINPKWIYIGYDNHKHSLVEPLLSKTIDFVEKLKRIGYDVRLKTMREKEELK